jgi:hypothetical protein
MTDKASCLHVMKTLTSPKVGGEKKVCEGKFGDNGLV